MAAEAAEADGKLEEGSREGSAGALAALNDELTRLTQGDVVGAPETTQEDIEALKAERADELEALQEIFADGEFQPLLGCPVSDARAAGAGGGAGEAPGASGAGGGASGGAGAGAGAGPGSGEGGGSEGDGTVAFRIRITPHVDEEEEDTAAYTKRVKYGVVYDHIWITFLLTDAYPNELPVFEIDSGGAFSPQQEDSLYEALLVCAAENMGMPMVYALTTEATEFTAAVFAEQRKSIARTKVNMVVSRKNRAKWDAMRHAEAAAKRAAAERGSGSGSGSGSDGDDGPEEPVAPPMSRDPAAAVLPTDVKPYRFVGSLASIVRRISDAGVAVVKIENVMRYDLAFRFETERLRMLRKYGEGELSQVSVAFHGTRTSVVGSIVSTGLVVPGSKGVRVVHGTRFGQGIYLSQYAEKSLNYVYSGEGGGGKLLVCAGLRGRVWRADVDTCNPRSCDSVSGDRGREWVFFRAAQVLPVYVIHFHWRRHKNVAYKMVSAGGSLLSVTLQRTLSDGGYNPSGQGAPTRAGVPEAEYQDARTAARIAAAEFYFGKRLRVVGLGEDADDDEDTSSVALMLASKIEVADETTGDPEEDGEFQQARNRHGQWDAETVANMFRWAGRATESDSDSDSS